jgi:hypothetical protein
MTPDERRLWIAATAADYLDALERDDDAEQLRLWELAATDADLEQAFHETHEGLLEEMRVAGTADFTAAAEAVKDAVERNLVGAEVLQATAGPVTAAMVARELFERPPARLSADAAKLNQRLLTVADELPANLDLLPLTAWLAATFGAAPAEYASAFRLTAKRLRLRAGSEAEVQLAARRASPPKGGPA